MFSEYFFQYSILAWRQRGTFLRYTQSVAPPILLHGRVRTVMVKNLPVLRQKRRLGERANGLQTVQEVR